MTVRIYWKRCRLSRILRPLSLRSLEDRHLRHLSHLRETESLSPPPDPSPYHHRPQYRPPTCTGRAQKAVQIGRLERIQQTTASKDGRQPTATELVLNTSGTQLRGKRTNQGHSGHHRRTGTSTAAPQPQQTMVERGTHHREKREEQITKRGLEMERHPRPPNPRSSEGTTG